MSYRRIFSLRELALCLVILANAVGFGATIVTTSMAASPALANVAAEGSDKPTAQLNPSSKSESGATERVNSVDHTASATGTLSGEPSSESVSSKESAQKQARSRVVDAPATTGTPVTEVLTGDVTLVDTTNDSLTQIPAGGNMVPAQDAGVVNEEDALSDTIPLNASTPESASLSTTTSPNPVIEPTTLEAAKTLLKADYDELLESGLDFSSTIEEIDRMAESDRYGKFGRR